MHAPGYGFLPEEVWRHAFMVLGFAMCEMTNIKYLIFLNIKIRAIWVTWALADLTKCFLKQYGVVLKSGAINPKQPIVWVRFDLTSSVERRGFRWLFIQLPAQKAMKNRFDWWASIETLSSPDACFFWFEAICGLSRGGNPYTSRVRTCL